MATSTIATPSKAKPVESRRGSLLLQQHNQAHIGREQRNASLAKKLLLIAVNFFCETSRLEPYAAVYLIEIAGWDPVNFGIVSLVMNLASKLIFADTPLACVSLVINCISQFGSTYSRSGRLPNASRGYSR